MITDKWGLTIKKLIMLFFVCIFFCRPAEIQAEYYQYKDSDGVLHFTDNLNAVPDEYLDQIKSHKERFDYFPEDKQKELKKQHAEDVATYRQQVLENHDARPTRQPENPIRNNNDSKTKIQVVNNRIIVPVTLAYSTRKVTANLLLDTGATGILLHSKVASKLEMDNVRRGSARVADGSSVNIGYTRIDYIMVGPKVKRNPTVMIIHNKSPDGYTDGLLGMSFLNDFPHTIDLRRKYIRWHY